MLTVLFLLSVVVLNIYVGYRHGKRYAKMNWDEKMLYNIERINANTGFSFGGFLLSIIVFILLFFLVLKFFAPLLLATLAIV
jgi:hypothetical protein